MSIPTTSERIVRALKCAFMERKRVSLVTNKREAKFIASCVACICSKPLPNSSSESGMKFGKSSVNNLLACLNGAVVHSLQPWVLCSTYTFIYFLWKHKDSDLIDEYNAVREHCITKDEDTLPLSLHQVANIVNRVILQYESSAFGEDEPGTKQPLNKSQIDALRSNLSNSRCLNESKALLEFPYKFGFYKIKERDEEDMRFFFNVLENPSFTLENRKVPQRRIVFDDSVVLLRHKKKQQRDDEYYSDDSDDVSMNDDVFGPAEDCKDREVAAEEAAQQAAAVAELRGIAERFKVRPPKNVDECLNQHPHDIAVMDDAGRCVSLIKPVNPAKCPNPLSMFMIREVSEEEQLESSEDCEDEEVDSSDDSDDEEEVYSMEDSENEEEEEEEEERATAG